ncbi:alcohol dehydrogenase catalytic domain-containing protein [Actinomadura rubrisoli]|uniref:alcohol dehydrogenase catalytic domain-containing protein n=1 Tax=Actinomadura rubrisoli TaxID=2530368 RepID=UPI001FB5F9B9|nr:zinc-binding dehydrogenase [Actinomadura rubrisoli]
MPSPGPGEVLIRVTAAGVNFVDISQTRGTFPGGPQPPYLAGIEGVGEVAAVGDGVTDLETGAHVIGVGIGGGAFAEYMVLPAEVLRLTGGTGADLVLESVGGATLDASLAATKRVTGRVVVHGVVGGEATITNWDLVYKHQIHLIGLNIGVLFQAAPHLFGEVMGQLSELLAAGVLGPGRPTIHELAEGPKALTELETRTTVGKLALLL